MCGFSAFQVWLKASACMWAGCGAGGEEPGQSRSVGAAGKGICIWEQMQVCCAALCFHGTLKYGPMYRHRSAAPV